jgi:PiT family inorganic phosphate transporter
MDVTILLFLTSGLFLGWALGANDAANVFGTAVGTRMVRFTTAAIICSVFVVLGAVISGAGAAHTLGKLGAINALPGSFMAAFSAGLAVYFMTVARVPVSTSQAIVGAIIGWNLFSENLTDQASLIKIMTTWLACPVLAALISMGLFKVSTAILNNTKMHLLRTDAYTRIGLILAGAAGSYSLGANNIANVMGVFVNSSPFTEFSVGQLFTVSSVQQLFLVGALAIAVGVFTYSKRVMLTVGGNLLPLSPVAAWVVVVSHSIVLFLFASQGLESFLASHDLPTIPLVPVSSSQAVVGAVMGIAILKGGRGIRWRLLGGIGVGWVVTPVIAGTVCFVGLFFLQNVFDQKVYERVPYQLSTPVVERLKQDGVDTAPLAGLTRNDYTSERDMDNALSDLSGLSEKAHESVLKYTRVNHLFISPALFSELAVDYLSAEQIAAVKQLEGQSFQHVWILSERLASMTPAWKSLPKSKVNKGFNKHLKNQFAVVQRLFHIPK